jgi:hypothetical protein
MVCRWLGMDRVFLTENAADSGKELVGSPALKKFTGDGFLQLETVAEPHAQRKVYEKCIREQRLHYNWIAFFDLDEFLVVRECVFMPSLCSNDFSFQTHANTSVRIQLTSEMF